MKNFNLPSAVIGALALIGLLSLTSLAQPPQDAKPVPKARRVPVVAGATVASDRWELAEFTYGDHINDDTYFLSWERNEDFFWCYLGEAHIRTRPNGHRYGEVSNYLAREVTWTNFASGETEKKLFGGSANSHDLEIQAKGEAGDLISELMNSYLEAMGEEGWQCFQHSSNDGGGTYFFRRKI